MADNWNDDDDDDEEQQQEDAAMYDDGEEDEDDILDMGEDDQPQSEDAALLMRFCPHDSSMLYPQEDKRTRTLMYACRRCRYTEESTQPLIYRNVLRKEVGNMLNNVPSAVSDDPTSIVQVAGITKPYSFSPIRPMHVTIPWLSFLCAATAITSGLFD
jgi:hypothetical protein